MVLDIQFQSVKYMTITEIMEKMLQTTSQNRSFYREFYN